MGVMTGEHPQHRAVKREKRIQCKNERGRTKAPLESGLWLVERVGRKVEPPMRNVVSSIP